MISIIQSRDDYLVLTVYITSAKMMIKNNILCVADEVPTSRGLETVQNLSGAKC